MKPHFLYEALGRDAAARQEAYRELFRDGLAPQVVDEIGRTANGNFVLANERFSGHISPSLGKRVVPGKAGRPRKPSEAIR
jgi:putative transposase